MQRSSPQMQNTSTALLLLPSVQYEMILYPTFVQAMPSTPDHCLHDSSTSITVTHKLTTRIWPPLQKHKHFPKASSGLCLSRSFSNAKQSSLIHVLQLNSAPLPATHQLPNPPAAPDACGSPCRAAFAPILHFIEGAKYLGIANCESYYIYDNITKLERLSLCHILDLQNQVGF